MTNQKAPPDNERKESGQGGARPRGFIDKGSPPADPIRGEYCCANGNEILFEIEEANSLPATVELKFRFDVDLEVEI